MSDTSSCPRCHEAVGAANIRCRNCGLVRSEFESFANENRETGSDDSGGFQLGTLQPGSSSGGFVLPNAGDAPAADVAPASPDSIADFSLSSESAFNIDVGKSSNVSLTESAVSSGVRDGRDAQRAGADSDPDVMADSGPLTSSAARNTIAVSCEHCSTVNRMPKSLAKSGVLCTRCGRPLVTSNASSTMDSASKLDSKITALAGKDRRKHLKRSVEKALAAPPASAENVKYAKVFSRGEWNDLKDTLESAMTDAARPDQIAAATDAIERIVETGDKRAVDFLNEKAESMPDELRGTAKRAWGELKTPGACDKLLQSLIDDVPEIFSDVARGLGKVGDRRATRTLLTLGTYWEEVRNDAIAALTDLGRVALPDLVGLAERKDKAVLRPLIAEVLGQIGDAQAIPVLANYLKNERRTPVRIAAAEALGEIEDRSVLGPLVSALKDRDDSVRIAASIALQGHPRKRIVPALVHILNDSNPVVRENAARLIGRCGVAKAISPLGLLTSDPVPETRVAVLESLGRLGDETAVPQLSYELTQARQDENDELTSTIAGVFGDLKDARANLPLLNAMPGARPTVQAKIIDALGEIGDTSVLPALVDTMTNGTSPAIRTAAVKALGKLGVPESVEPLQRALQVGPPLKAAATSALGDVPHEASISALVDLLTDKDANIRRLAATSLGRVGNESVFRKLRPLLEDGDERVSEAAADALKALGDESAVAAKPDAKSKKESKKAAKPKKVKIKKSRKKRSLPSFNFEMLQGLTPSDLVTVASEYRAVTGAIAAVVVLILGGVFYGGAMVNSVFTGGLDRSIVVRGVLNDVAISPDGNKVAMARDFGVLDVYDMTLDGVTVDKKGPANTGVLFGSDAQTLYSRSASESARWNLETQEFEPADGFEKIAFNGDHSKVITVKGSSVSELDLATGKATQLTTFKAPASEAVLSLAATPDLGRVVMGFRRGVVLIWNRGQEGITVMQTGVEDAVSALAISSDGSELAIGLARGDVLIWEAGAREEKTRLTPTEARGVSFLSYVSDSTLLVVRVHETQIVDLGSGQPKQTFAPACGNVSLVSVSADGSRAAFAEVEGDRVAVHSMADGSLVKLIDVPDLEP